MTTESREPWLETLAEFARTKSDADFARFVKESKGGLWSLFTAYNIGRTREDRRELIQDLLFDIHRYVHCGTITEAECHKGYIKKIALHLGAGRHRHDGRHKRRPDRPVLPIGSPVDGGPPIDPPDDSEPPPCIDLPILKELPEQERQYHEAHYRKGLQGQELEQALGLTTDRVRGLKDRFERKCKLLIGLKAIHKQKQVSDRDYTIFVEDQIWDLLKPETAKRNHIAQREIQPRVIHVLDLINDWLDANGAEPVTLNRTKTKPVKDGSRHP